MESISNFIKNEYEKHATRKKQRADLRYLESSLVLEYVKKVTKKNSIYSVRNVEHLKEIQNLVQKDLININAHNNYSAAVLHYLSFISLTLRFK